jgi:hypothetical protein
VNEQELTVRVGELATAVGYPLPSITWVDNAKIWAVLRPRGVAAPVLQLDRRVSQWCTPLFDLVVAESLQRAAFGMHRHHRILQVGYLVMAAASVVVVDRLFALPLLPEWAVTMAAVVLAVLLISATYARWLYRRVDRRLREILGTEALREGLEHVRRPMNAANVLRWLWAGAGVLPGERLRWLNASVAY